MVLEKPIVIDCRDHLHGRLCSVVAKELLAGQKIVLVRCEDMVISGSLVRNQTKYAQFRKKRMNTNPSRGPFHFKSPAVWSGGLSVVWSTKSLIADKQPLDVFPPSRESPTLTTRSSVRSSLPPFVLSASSLDASTPRWVTSQQCWMEAPRACQQSRGQASC
ncbi:60S ribosomal protein L13a [Skeletonema marinoi]|uniref:60S ribosomal protein L13a n=1 Tax=Skeletonema marinoi TaxID=267567 RepID=A0AAD9DHE8_9STRA|nr:60S ribosomal protein L13a [Skeletonema marinoi]